VDRDVVLAGAVSSSQCHLMRPLSVNRSLAEFAFAVDHSTPVEVGAARRLHYLPGGWGEAFVRCVSGVDLTCVRR
jgi:hypothetical protein